MAAIPPGYFDFIVLAAAEVAEEGRRRHLGRGLGAVLLAVEEGAEAVVRHHRLGPFREVEGAAGVGRHTPVDWWVRNPSGRPSNSGRIAF